MLKCLSKADYSTKVDLTISIDKSDKMRQLLELCNNFEWKFGNKTILPQEIHLGLVKHVFKCADLTKKYESIILLEDDHYLSPKFYLFAQEALKFFESDENISGISLFSIEKNGIVQLPFIPILENNDVFFAQLCFPQGFVITSKQWNKFLKWYNTSNNSVISEGDNIHDIFKKFDDVTEWFHIFTNYLIKNNSFIVYPRESYCIHFQEISTHFKKPGTWHQNPIQKYKDKFSFKNKFESVAVFDSYLEIDPEVLKKENKNLNTYEFEVDFYASKSKKNIKTKYLLTTRQVKNSLLSFAKIMKPLDMNVIENINGNGIYLAKTKNVKFGILSTEYTKRSNYYYFHSGLILRDKIIFLIIRILGKIRLI